MSRKTWLGACGALLVGALAMTASASITFSVNLTAIDGVPLGAGDNPKQAIVTHVGQKFSFDLWVTIQGQNSARDEDYAQVIGGLISYAPLAGPGGLKTVGTGRFIPAGSPIIDYDDEGNEIVVGHQWWNEPMGGGTGSSPGKANHIQTLSSVFGDMPNDDSLDIGSPVPVGSTVKGDWMEVISVNKYSNRPAPLPSGLTAYQSITPAGNRAGISTPPGFKMKLLSFEWQVESMNDVPGNQTAINWLPRLDTTLAGGVAVSAATATWADDNQALTGQTGQVVLDAPVILQIVPEPASLSILALGALGLLARRRK